MRGLRLLADSVYDQQIERLKGLEKFPLVPAAEKELRNALRRVTDSDAKFLHRLITDVVDHESVCPTPAQLADRGFRMRERDRNVLGAPKEVCPICGGNGWISAVKHVKTSAGEYDADYAERCSCQRL